MTATVFFKTTVQPSDLGFQISLTFNHSTAYNTHKKIRIVQERKIQGEKYSCFVSFLPFTKCFYSLSREACESFSTNLGVLITVITMVMQLHEGENKPQPFPTTNGILEPPSSDLSFL